MNRLKIQTLESRRMTGDIYKVVGCLIPDWLRTLISAQIKLRSDRFMQHFPLWLRSIKFIQKQQEHQT